MQKWIILLSLCVANSLIASPIIVAHRGASAYLPEHTLAAKAMAHALGADYIEQDVVLSKDNVPMVLHDIHIDTVTDVAKKFPQRQRSDGRYYAVDFNLAELKTLNVSERFNYKTNERYFPGRFPAGKSSFQIPTLAEEIELIEGLNTSTNKNVGLYLEIKQPEFHLKEKRDIAKIVYELLKQYGFEDKPMNDKKPRIYLQCFYAETLKRFKNEFKSKIPRIQLIAENAWGESSNDYNKMQTKEGLADIATYAVGIGPWIPQLLTSSGRSPPLTGLAKQAGLKIHPYTVRADQLPPGIASLDTLHRLLFKVLKVDGIFTDFPDRSVAWRNKHFNQGS